MSKLQSDIKLGYVPLTDSAPLIIAHAKGLFVKQGLQVTLQKIHSWATVRDKISLGLIDGAPMLSPLPLAMQLGLEPMPVDMLTAFSMGLNGNGITISNSLHSQLQTISKNQLDDPQQIGEALKQIISMRSKTDSTALTFAIVHPFSTHNYLLRYWLSSCGINPDTAIKIIVVSPAQMTEELKQGRIDGYCVGEPWNALAEHQGLGKVIISGKQIWNNAPEKVFAVSRQWAETHTAEHEALISALLEAAIWCDAPENRHELVSLLAQPDYLNLAEEVIGISLLPANDPQQAHILQNNHVFYRHAANFPWCSHAIWNLLQMIHNKQWSPPLEDNESLFSIARKVYASHIYRSIAMKMDLPVPIVIDKSEGKNLQSWLLENATKPLLLGADRFIDGLTFDPNEPLAYLQALQRSQDNPHGFRDI